MLRSWNLRRLFLAVRLNWPAHAVQWSAIILFLNISMTTLFLVLKVHNDVT